MSIFGNPTFAPATIAQVSISPVGWESIDVLVMTFYFKVQDRVRNRVRVRFRFRFGLVLAITLQFTPEQLSREHVSDILSFCLTNSDFYYITGRWVEHRPLCTERNWWQALRPRGHRRQGTSPLLDQRHWGLPSSQEGHPHQHQGILINSEPARENQQCLCIHSAKLWLWRIKS